ncbi:allophanate hydrolase [Nocardia seriolae]|uniref:Allophanate hydrolase n=1 Tax=Nocardia seriolae TaxID=37332 RepID=A0A0B8N7S4_9NOCA|nr:allophanate hydrolase [Nocardia seriolae]MTJ66334.1 allophanate hydrolase [Nocardia seriolae]MTJ69844.1 allophanate hydrolase [Nocardia seriolae]MTJ85753.1 allophanate hydrolase [Nocardia seriolae]MTK29751.1 allophanate hydrolase [Nocardia seriolae]MTK44328.1 allophanate hydrolase [Nocardia seriolae]
MNVWINRRPAAEVEAEIATATGALAGLRLAVKDNVDVAGLPTTAACPDFAYTPDRDAPVVDALRAAGAAVVGKTNLDQFATGLVGTRSPYGAVENATRPGYVSGGSSSGSAVAVASGAADIALGTDTAGSGRVPAAFQGLVGIKPTVGVLSTDGVVPACRSYDCVTVFAADLHRADLAMSVMAAGAPDRPWPADVRLAAPPRPVVAVFADLPDLDPLWRSAFERTVASLRERGATIVAVDPAPFLAAARLLYDGALVAERYAAVGEFVDAHPESVDPTVGSIVRSARELPAHRLVTDLAELERLRATAMASLAGTDALLTPTAPTHPTIAEVAADPIGVNSRLGTYTNFCNLFDLCAVAIPTDEPYFGVTVLARAFEDAVALDIAALITGTETLERAWPTTVAPATELIVFGAHLRGQPLEHQLTALGARWCGPVETAANYRLAALDTVPPKPAVTPVPATESGVAVAGERWLLSPAALGRFLAHLPAPMQLGAVELSDGTWRTGFGCTGAAAESAKDISEYGGWRAALAAGAVG